jgi:hypothetical protein
MLLASAKSISAPFHVRKTPVADASVFTSRTVTLGSLSNAARISAMENDPDTAMENS